MDALLANNEVLGRVTSVFFMLISLGLLIRTTTKSKKRKTESYERRVFDLEQEVNTLKRGREKFTDY